MTITHGADVLTVAAAEPVPGLRIYRLPQGLFRSPYDVRLAHHSGAGIATFEYLGDAAFGAEVIADMADWTRPADELTADPELGQRVTDALRARTPGIVPRPTVPSDADG